MLNSFRFGKWVSKAKKPLNPRGRLWVIADKITYIKGTSCNTAWGQCVLRLAFYRLTTSKSLPH